MPAAFSIMIPLFSSLVLFTLRCATSNSGEPRREHHSHSIDLVLVKFDTSFV